MTKSQVVTKSRFHCIDYMPRAKNVAEEASIQKLGSNKSKVVFEKKQHFFMIWEKKKLNSNFS